MEFMERAVNMYRWTDLTSKTCCESLHGGLGCQGILDRMKLLP